MKKFISALMALTIMVGVVSSPIAKPVTADASIHLDFWNDYEDGCYVYYELKQSNGYAVIVISNDEKRMWSNTTDYIQYWYSKNQLETMVHQRVYGYGSIYNVDIKADLLNDATYFCKGGA